jgi:hypothetical protein|tara:strand:- start:594 stop:1001 length:408 start_codon:yes stop_codon:yes gene_type:complete
MVFKHLFKKSILALVLFSYNALVPSLSYCYDIIQGKISKVRLYTDRAEITRSIQQNIPAGKSSFSEGPMPNSIRPASVRVSLIGNSSARIINVKTTKDFGGDFLSEDIVKQEEVVNLIQKELDTAQGLLKIINIQ